MIPGIECLGWSRNSVPQYTPPEVRANPSTQRKLVIACLAAFLLFLAGVCLGAKLRSSQCIGAEAGRPEFVWNPIHEGGISVIGWGEVARPSYVKKMRGDSPHLCRLKGGRNVT